MLPPTGADVERAYEVAPPDIQKSTVNPDGGALNLVFRTGPGSLDHRAVYVNEIRDDLASGSGGGDVTVPPGISATPSGLAVVGVGLLENIESNRILLTYLAVAFVFAFLTVRLRSVVRALLSMVPVLIATGAASLVAWAFDLQLSPMTAVGGPLVVALCTEFTSLILLRFIEERQRGYSPRDAVECHRGADRPGVHRVGAHRHLGRGGHRLLVAAVAAGLRPDRGHERDRRPAVGAGVPAADAGVG